MRTYLHNGNDSKFGYCGRRIKNCNREIRKSIGRMINKETS
jgi:hypothetical protein